MLSRSDKLKGHMERIHGVKEKQASLKRIRDNLLTIFMRLEPTIWLAEKRNTHKSMKVIAQNFATNHHQSITTEHIQQIKYIWPEAYILEWKRED